MMNISTVQNAETLRPEQFSTEFFLNFSSKGLTKTGYKATLKSIAQSLAQHLNASHTYIFLNDSACKIADVIPAYADAQDPGQTSASEELMRRILSSGKAEFLPLTAENPDFAHDPQFQRYNIVSAMAAPVRRGSFTFGLLYVDINQESDWGTEHFKTLQAAAVLLGFMLNEFYLSFEVGENKRLAAAGKATLILSHSVKNILQLIGGAAEVIDFALRSNEMHRVRKSWDILRPNLTRLRKFVRDMLDYSKERELEKGPCEFNRVLQGAIETLRDQLKRTGIKINIRTDQAMPTVLLDSERIHEMSLNLILNAFDICDLQKGIIDVQTRYLPGENELCLTVQDNGPGMTPEVQARIFEPFESTKNKIGTGLGMAIAKQIIDQHKGRIEIETELGKGTAFHVYLPAEKCPENSGIA